MVAPQPRRHMTADQFLAAYEGVPGRWELVRGEVYGMTGTTYGHEDTVDRVHAVLRERLQDKPCRALRDGIGLKTAIDTTLYPDIAVYCDARDLDAPSGTLAFRYPSVVVEVLSSSTRAFDLGEKLELFQALETLGAVVIVDPEAKRAWLHRRNGDDWTRSPLTADRPAELNAIGVNLGWADIFTR